MPQPVTRCTRLDHQLAATRRLPERSRVGVELGQRRRLDHAAGSAVKMIAEVGTPSPEVTRDTSAPSTCAVEVPRICRTPSAIRLKPCTYASLMPAPLVLTGSRPPSSMPPSSVN